MSDSQSPSTRVFINFLTSCRPPPSHHRPAPSVARSRCSVYPSPPAPRPTRPTSGDPGVIIKVFREPPTRNCRPPPLLPVRHRLRLRRRRRRRATVGGFYFSVSRARTLTRAVFSSSSRSRLFGRSSPLVLQQQ
ncbi:unnamed protein product [Aphis gossypii]|uniref:Uncharacterized protein n=1 Tax=Aphis gossypii TaxID=80765 RepID=A0A9P0NQH8_APHGO|nr:unnamed protein product [Aphis gossypii]